MDTWKTNFDQFPQLHGNGHAPPNGPSEKSILAQKMKQARIVGASLSVSRTDPVLNRSGEVNVARTYQDQPKEWHDRKVDFNAVRLSAFRDGAIQPNNMVRMTIAPMDYNDLNMIPIGSQRSASDLSQIYPNSASITGFVTEFNGTGSPAPSDELGSGTAPAKNPAVRFEFNVVIEYCPTPDMMSLVHVDTSYTDSKTQEKGMNAANNPGQVGRAIETLKNNTGAITEGLVRTGVELLPHMLGSKNPDTFVHSLHSNVNQQHAGCQTPKTNENSIYYHEGKININPKIPAIIPIPHIANSTFFKKEEVHHDQDSHTNGSKYFDGNSQVSEFKKINHEQRVKDTGRK